MTSSVAIALGGNLGNVSKTFRQAVTALEQTPGLQVISRSRDYLTQPIGTDAGEAYRNAVVLGETSLQPFELLRALQEIETTLGRVRTVHWGPRTLDLDLLNYGNQTICIPATHHSGHSTLDTRLWTLCLPHPSAWFRRFVLDPWSEVAGDWQHPVLEETVTEMRNRLQKRPLRILLNDSEVAWKEKILSRIQAEFSDSELHISLDETNGDEFEICFNRFLSASKKSLARRSITLSHDAAGSEMAVQVLRAALDEPSPVEAT